APFELSTWTVAGDDLLIAGVDDAGARVYRFVAGAFLPAAGALLGNVRPTALAVSPNFATDGTVLAGDIGGRVHLSTDGGTSFAPLGQPLPTDNGIGEVSVAFDTHFAGNRTVYAASRAAVSAQSRQRLFWLALGTGSAWQSIAATLADGATVGSLVATAGGGLWATNSQPVNAAGADGGTLRTLDPTLSLGATFETVIGGLDDGAVLEGLWADSNRLWSVDSQNVRIMTFLDSLLIPPAPASPENETPGLATDGLRLHWLPTPGATRYRWQVDYDGDFASVPDGLEGTTGTTSRRLPALTPGTTYHWRVRATEPALSPWSAAWSFTTALGSAALELMSPKAGIDGVPLAPVFQWSAVSGADGYELVVSTDSLFADPVIYRWGALALPATAWQSDTELEYGETYFWKVRGRSSNSFSAWSAVAAFTTETPPPTVPPPAPAEPEETEPAPQDEPAVEPVEEAGPIPVQFEPPPVMPVVATTVEIAIPAWALAAVIGLLATLVLLLITVLVVIGRVRRY
ncbi:MAG: fibronectin type III domain-containing protein, partial [Dehalococcoidales bacterium]